MVPSNSNAPGTLETDAVLVRTMGEQDLATIVEIDAAATGRRRPQYFQLMIDRSVRDAALQISLIAELEGRTAGFLLASLYYGEYGVAEPTASIDAVGVDPARRGQHVATALMRQLRLNLGALHIQTLRTQVSWDDFELLGFFQREGFRPSTRLCLERVLDPTSPEE